MREPIFTGVCTALVTPMRQDGVNYDGLLEHFGRQIDSGVDAVCVCGTTGEAATLSDGEKYEIIARTVRYCKGKVPVIAGTGSNDTAHAVAMSRMADAMGVDAVLAVTPYYNKATPDGLTAHFIAIADAVACPVILYNVPSRTGVTIPLDVYWKLQEHPRIAGVKEASGDISYGSRILSETADDFYLWSGNDDQTVPLLSLGAKGVISVLSNLCPDAVCGMTRACFSGAFDEAAETQLSFLDLIGALFAEVNPIPIKTAMNLLGMDVGTARLPLCEMSAPALERLKSAMRAHGLL